MLTRDLIKGLARAWYGREIDDAGAERAAASLAPLLDAHGKGPEPGPFADDAAGFASVLAAEAEKKSA